MTHQKFDTYSEALQHVNEEEAARIQSQIDYNKVDELFGSQYNLSPRL